MSCARRWRACGWPWSWRGPGKIARRISTASTRKPSGSMRWSAVCCKSRAPKAARIRCGSEPSLDRLLEEVVADSSLEAQACGSEVRLVSAQPVTVQDDAELLRRAIENVIRNAIRHAPEATAVDASLEAANGRAALRIRNYGPGVPDEAP